jgi:hypothetical protein
VPGVQAIRSAVVCCKVWGGNRTWAGAGAWQVLASVLRTASQQGRDPIELLVGLLRAPLPIVAGLVIPALIGIRRPPHAQTLRKRYISSVRTQAVTT